MVSFIYRHVVNGTFVFFKVGACAHKITVPNSWIYSLLQGGELVSKPFQLGSPDFTY